MFQKDAHIRLESQHGFKGLREQVDLTKCDAMVRFNVEQIESALLTGLSTGILRPENIKGRVLDFGCGRGVSTALLASHGGDVTGVELHAQSIEQGKALEFVPADKIINANGIEYLNSLPPKTLDLVSASMLGPDTNGTLCRSFLNACQHALRPGGVILVTSDVGTMETLARINPLGNGFTQGGVFIAIRGVEESLQPIPLKSFDFGLGERGAEIDFRKLFGGISPDVLAQKLKLEG